MKLLNTCIISTLLTLSSCETYFQETFSDDGWTERWVQSKWKPDMGKFVLSSGDSWKVDAEIEQGMQTSEDAKFYAISSKFASDKVFSNKDQDLVIQFSVKNVDKSSSFCGGGYIKLLPTSLDQEQFGGDSPYMIMFGPDICGYDVSRIHLIFNYENENLLKKEDIKLSYEDKDDLTHLYTLVVKPDNSYVVYFDQDEKASGKLIEEWDFPQKMIPDETDIKPSDWIDDEMMDDPEDVKPEGWDDIPEKIADPDAKKPEDWDEEDDGEWEPPMIKNPEYKGEWEPKKINNPEYKGPWIQKQKENPDFKEDVYIYENIGAVGFELWIVNSGSIFDNIYVGNSLDEAKALATDTWVKITGKEEEVKKAYEDANKEVEDTDDDDEEEADDLDASESKDEL